MSSIPFHKMKQIVSVLSEDLGIVPPPLIRSDAQTLGTKIAALEMPNGRLLIRHDLPVPETLLALAHELRHLWQIRNGLFNDSISPEHYTDSSVDLEAYALQPCEVEANAYAQSVCEDLLGIRPLWQGYSDKVKAAIAKRYDAIREPK